MQRIDCIVVGAGVIGLAVAGAVARTGRGVIVLERERQFGRHASSRNSEVIHAGIHYEPGSLKARLCVSGRELLYRYCELRGIAHRRCGKLTVAANAADVPLLQRLERMGRDNGVLDLQWLDGAAARRIEPALACHAALASPATGIIDSHAYMQCLLADAESGGVDVAYGTDVTALHATRRGVEVCIDAQTRPQVRAAVVVNCAGVQAARVAACIADFPAAHVPIIHRAKGSYFSLDGPAPFAHLVYPAPAADGHLGIHMTLDLAGGARFGPDLQWLEEPRCPEVRAAAASNDYSADYAVDPSRAAAFAAAIRRYWPAVLESRLRPAYAGIRAKLSPAGGPSRDFRISGPAEHGVPGIINLFGIDSPGLTASLALGEMIAASIETG